jgi:hypothetical protein
MKGRIKYTQKYTYITHVPGTVLNLDFVSLRHRLDSLSYEHTYVQSDDDDDDECVKMLFFVLYKYVLIGKSCPKL